MAGQGLLLLARRCAWTLAATAAIAIGTMATGCRESTSSTSGATAAPSNAAASAAAPAHDASDRAARSPDDEAHLSDFATGIGADCKDAARGRGCIIGNVDAGDFYDIELTPLCDANGFFAGVVSAHGALFDTLPTTGSASRTVAELGKDQFVCIQAIARTGQQPAYYLVTAVAPRSIPACRGKRICTLYGERPVRRHGAPGSGAACTVDTAGLPRGDCPSGWIDAASVEAFSNGL